MELSKLIAIIRDVDAVDVIPIVRVLIEEGISTVEVSLSNEEKGLQCIEKLAKSFDKEELFLGAGTVINEKQMEQVVHAGGQYIITPGWNKELVKKALEKQLTVFPGVYSPGEIAEAVELEIDYLKFFPINGVNEDYLKSLRGPFPKINIIGVGGISPMNIPFYQELGIQHFGIGSELVPRGAGQNDLEKIRANAKQFKQAIEKEGSI
ncbi:MULTISPECIES: bifunctional 4-hydroxy-2-oxoglutarate aldolase/2-dehydro-3-deoxy-phosphogluconate aldolase [Enterococcus]|uniref:bifunctional 4-hydroxy-2-oxoglutarate aldolase/2-dehydro-3-deoxy-phosphogluconate aldolase n=1 Tax=Enterococcus TaxID=1350 RepID=UPI001484E16B|nr:MULTISPECIES: bifunctional 4-hydroxy-2-oxoglutarate aldolase/2-dehydro-3-deoxy-phosphogluconate aldolase [Enterococcus]MDT2681302.1 bifunctional 4-hydroxy-2-oxoglutarate aldolase/2-dehydro-3-deoxy-phosphogluconate aldolase [Enterococcus gallinarum]